MSESRKVAPGMSGTRSQKDRARYVSPAVIGVRTDRSAKNDTDSGLTAAQKKAVIAEEKSIRGKETEFAAVIDREGNVVRRLGQNDAHHVSFATVPREELKDAVIIHNHPVSGQREMFGNTLATRVGSPLSAQDLMFAAANNLAEMRATTYSGNGGGYTYSIRRPKGGWPSDVDFMNLFVNTRQSGQAMAWNEFARIALNPSGSEEVDKQRKSRGELVAQWRSIQDMAKALGSTITRRRF